MNYGDKVTIGLPCYNVEPYLESCLNSILNQTYENWELIAIDDGSSDRTLEILKAVDDKRVKVFSDGENKGLAARLNEIVDLCQTEILFRMDSDDLMVQQRIEKQMKYLRENPNIDLLGTAMLSVDNQLNPKAVRMAPESPTVEDAFSGNYVNHATIAGSINWFRSNRYNEDLKVSEDFDLWTRSATRTNVASLSDVLYVYREFGVFSHQKYRIQTSVSKFCIMNYGPSSIGLFKTFLSYGARILKDVVYFVFYISGNWEQVFKLRNKSLAGEEFSFYKKMVDKALGKVEQNERR